MRRLHPKNPLTRLTLGCSLFCAALWTGPVAAQPAPATEATEVIAHVRDSLQQWMAAHHIPGLSIAVGRAEGLVWTEAFGWAEVAHQIPLHVDTPMRAASLSKPLTSVAVGLLYERGRLDLDRPVQFYLPYFPPKRWYFTTRQLAGHLAGIRHYQAGEFYSTRAYKDVNAALTVFQYAPLLHEPGTRYHYSTYGWTLISAVVEAASGVAFLDFMQHHVFDPLDMHHTAPETAQQAAVQYYQWRGGKLVTAPYVDNSLKWAGGGFLSTAPDLVRLGRSMQNATLLHPDTIDLLLTPQFTTDGTPTNYGMGWAVRDQDGRRYIGHTGGAVGASTVLVLSREDDVVVALLANLENVTMYPIGMYILDQFAKVTR